jgi:hypothetical protein
MGLAGSAAVPEAGAALLARTQELRDLAVAAALALHATDLLLAAVIFPA